MYSPFFGASALPAFVLTLSHGSVNKPTVCNSFTEEFQLLGDMLEIGTPWKL